jgi:hypothetical protein
MFRVRLSGSDIAPTERRAHLVWEGSLGNPPGPDGGKSRPEGTRWSDLPELASMEREVWPDAPGSPRLWRRLLEEGAASDVWTGETPETWSPLGKASYSSFGALAASTRTALAMAGRRRGGRDGAVPSFLERSGVQILELASDSETLGALTFTPFAFLVPIDHGAEQARLSLIDDPVVHGDLEVRDAELRGLGLEEPVESVLVWRLYRGGNSSTTESISTGRGGTFRIPLGVVEGAAYLVGRLAMTVNRRMRRPERDPWFEGRLDRAVFDDLKLKRATAEECPDVGDLSGSSGMGPDAIVAVHGTMGCAVPLARALAVDLAGRAPILRFEHDTWHPIGDNARELAAAVQEAGLERVLFVAHSRGGLVARHAMGVLRDEAPDIETRLIAVGTPFAGTPLIGAAESGLLGMHTALGALRLLTGPVLDAVSRLTGLLLKGRLPAGIREMHPNEAYLGAFAGSSTDGISAIAGRADPNGAAESYGIAIALRRGALRGVFRDEATGNTILNDYVVPTASASSRIAADRTLEVECDHFSFFNHPEVRAYLAADDWRASSTPTNPSADEVRRASDANDDDLLVW